MSQSGVKPFWEQEKVKGVFGAQNVRYLKLSLKTIIYSFSAVMIFWSFIQTFAQRYTNYSTEIGHGLEFGFKSGTTKDYRFDLFSFSMYGPGYSEFFDGSNLWYGPFLNWFVLPFAKLFLNLIYEFSKVMNYGFDVMLAMIIMIALARFITFWGMLRAAIYQDKQLNHKNQLEAISKKYGESMLLDSASKAAKHREVMNYQRKHSLKPMAALENFFINTPIFLIFFKLVTICRPVKATRLMGIWVLSKTPFSMVSGSFLDMGWCYLVLCALIFPVNYLSQKLPSYLSKLRNGGRSLSSGMDGQPPMAQKIQKFLPIIFIFFAFFWSTGLAIYYFLNSLFTMLQAYIIHLILSRRKTQESVLDSEMMRLGIQ